MWLSQDNYEIDIIPVNKKLVIVLPDELFSFKHGVKVRLVWGQGSLWCRPWKTPQRACPASSSYSGDHASLVETQVPTHAVSAQTVTWGAFLKEKNNKNNKQANKHTQNKQQYSLNADFN